MVSVTAVRTGGCVRRLRGGSCHGPQELARNQRGRLRWALGRCQPNGPRFLGHQLPSSLRCCSIFVARDRVELSVSRHARAGYAPRRAKPHVSPAALTSPAHTYVGGATREP